MHSTSENHRFELKYEVLVKYTKTDANFQHFNNTKFILIAVPLWKCIDAPSQCPHSSYNSTHNWICNYYLFTDMSLYTLYNSVVFSVQLSFHYDVHIIRPSYSHNIIVYFREIIKTAQRIIPEHFALLLCYKLKEITNLD